MATASIDSPNVSRIALLGFAISVLALIALVVAPFGYRYGIWDFGFALLVLMKYGAYGAVVGTLISLIGLGRTWPGAGKNGLVLAIAGVVAGGFTGYTVHNYYTVVRTVPFIHDITTDTEDPPQYSAVLPMREAAEANPHEYGGPELAAQQKYGYPDLVTLNTSREPATAFNASLAVARSLGWEIVDENAETGRIEATDTSDWYQFKDDIVIRIRPAADGQGSEIDMRSLSRVGRSDVGVNAARIRETFRLIWRQLGER